jgi:hypothetical protein
MGKHKSRHSSNILSPIHRNIAAAQRVLLECVCVCVRLVFVSSFSFSLSSLSFSSCAVLDCALLLCLYFSSWPEL